MGDATPSDEDAAAQPPSSTSMRRFWFTDSCRMLLLNCIREKNAHLAEHGTKDDAFRAVLEKFIALTPENRWRRVQKPKLKSIRDKFRTMMSERKKTVETNAAASGIAEEDPSLEELLLDEFLFEEREQRETGAAQAQDRVGREQALAEAGRNILEQSLQRRPSNSSAQNRRRAAAEMNDDVDTFTFDVNNQLSKRAKISENEVKVKEMEMQMRSSELCFQREQMAHNANSAKLQIDMMREQNEKNMEMMREQNASNAKIHMEMRRDQKATTDKLMDILAKSLRKD